jgi:hypothetical protein
MNEPLPNTSGMVPVHVNAVPAEEAVAITSIDQFAMHVDHWHATCMQQGNSVVALGAEGVKISLEDDAKPGEILEITLDAITAQIFRLGAMTALNVFKDLPFGASLEEDPAENAAG